MHSILNEMSLPQPSPQGSEIYAEEEVKKKKTVRTRYGELLQQIAFSR